MAGSPEDRWRIRRRRLADLYGDGPEEGEVVPAGYHSDADTEEYYNTNRGCSSDSVPADYRGASTFPAAAHNYGSASTSSASANNNGGGASSSPAAQVLACPFCGKEFRNHKAVCGHMKVHREQGIGKANKGIKRNAAAVGGWGGTGKRGCSGSRGRAAPPIDEPDQSMAVVVAEAKIVFNPMPLAFAAPNPPPAPTATETPNPPPAPTATETPNQSTPMASPTPKMSSSSVPAASVMTNDPVESSSAPPMRDDAMETVVAGAANPPTEAVVHLHDAPPPPPPAAGEQAHEQPVAPPPGGRQNPKGYTCKRCGMWFRTHQGLGGHVVGHKNREIAVALHGGAVRNGRDAKPGKAHVCKVCGREFPGGLQLGGHMRKHWTGSPFNKKKPRLVAPPLRLALSIKADEASPAPRPAVAGRVLLFGIDIGAGVKTPAAQECSPAPEASASASGEQ
ncbi:hypothetical protein SETIT_5G249400v2 [Setaria italica]|nr:hypothetical protein SETIT_5G249400v2 [Setaria italica]TKW15749.1 hypothetical protein SEVIR_5G257000v2 [Setaria viridis]